MPIKHGKMVRVAVAAYAVQGLAMASLLFNANRVRKQGAYLADFVGRHVDELDEFDIIALHDLGLIKSTKGEG